MSGRLRSIVGRWPPPARRVAALFVGVAVLGAVASALEPVPETGPAHRSSSERRPGATRASGGERRTVPVSAVQLGLARQAAARFLAGYLRFAYGQGPGSAVRAATPALRRQLQSERALATPVERRRHPRVLSLHAAGEAGDAVLITALVDDGGIADYSLRLTLVRQGGAWLVSAVDGA